jgi:hypothetical protein
MQLFYVRYTTASKRRRESVIDGGMRGYVSVQIAVQITHTQGVCVSVSRDESK